MTEIFEVIERLSSQRAMEIVFLSANDALDWLENAVPEERHKNYRVQSVKVYEKRVQ